MFVYLYLFSFIPLNPKPLGLVLHPFSGWRARRLCEVRQVTRRGSDLPFAIFSLRLWLPPEPPLGSLPRISPAMARFGGIFAAVAGVFLVQRLGQARIPAVGLHVWGQLGELIFGFYSQILQGLHGDSLVNHSAWLLPFFWPWLCWV